MVWKVLLTIAEIVLIGAVWLNWSLAVPTPFFIALVFTLVLLQHIAERFSAKVSSGNVEAGENSPLDR